jgi:A/G-specific adenine glycosylase
MLRTSAAGVALQIDSLPEKQYLQTALLAWYAKNRRELPWRRDHNPYRVWVSEIMLQQTRVAAVLGHYDKFLRRFPTIEKLAAAREASVLTAWSGLGYYRRARNLHATAKIIVRNGGQLPRTAAEWRLLPGIGRYTAAAISSIASNEAVAVVDGNVERVLRRLFGSSITTNECWKPAGALLSRENPGDFNQAMMELGATVCLPDTPLCDICPVVRLCRTKGCIRNSRKQAPQRKREICYALGFKNESVFLTLRSENESLMPGMWELPQIEDDGTAFLTLRHSITVTNYLVRVREVQTIRNMRGRWVPRSRITRLPLTGLTRKILRAAKII